MPFMLLSLLIQVTLVVHIIKTGRTMTWVFIVMLFPLVGTLAYIIIELWPEWSQGAQARKFKRQFTHSVNPERELQRANKQLAIAPTIDNTLAVAEQLLEKGEYQAAHKLFNQARQGLYLNDPHILLGLAKAEFAMEDYLQTLATLDSLKQYNPEFKSAEGHMLYARAKQLAGFIDDAIAEYQVLCQYFIGPEAYCRLAELYQQRGQSEQAQALWQTVLTESDAAGKHYQQLYKSWIAQAKRQLQ